MTHTESSPQSAEGDALRHAVVLLAEEWDLTEFPDERTAMIMRADLHRLLEADAMRVIGARVIPPGASSERPGGDA